MSRGLHPRWRWPAWPRAAGAVLHSLAWPLLLLAAAGCQPAATPAVPSAAPSSAAAAAPPAVAAADQIGRGRTLAVLGNCAGCHTARDGAAYAGGVPLKTPFGVAYGGNLTPDDATGLGRWSADDFWRALHLGRAPDGRALVPAFPYTSYTHVTREDSDALFAYLRSLPPVQQANRPHALRFPYGTRLALWAWQWWYFSPADLAGEAAARAAMAPRLARGAYLVQGLGHCAACHAPRDSLGGPAAQARGGLMPMQDWFAPSLHPVAGQPATTATTADELLALLKTGQTARAAVLGPMAGVVYQSTQHWPDDDLRAVAEHLARLPPDPAPAAAPPASPQVMALGQRVYTKHCADCHGARGEGVPGAYPALARNATVAQPQVHNLVKVLHHGGFAPTTAGQPRPYGMPPQMLSDEEAAAVLSFVRQSWGHQYEAVTALEVMKLR